MVRGTMNKPQKYTATISDKKWIAKKVIEVKFLLKDPPQMLFDAGQTMMIYIAPGINRTMSIASSPSIPNELTVCWDVSPMGPGAHWLLDHRVGDEVQFMAPLGIFVFDQQQEQHVRTSVFVATGTGIAPYRAFLDSYLAQGILKETHLYWGLRHEDDIFWKEIFESYEQSFPQFHFHISLSQPSSAWQGLKGHVTEHILQSALDMEAVYYLCGSGAMVEEMHTGLTAKGIPEPHIKRELFFN
jgi:CDP-4-dehydro-6-deoxyglucose reductase, E3